MKKYVLPIFVILGLIAFVWGQSNGLFVIKKTNKEENKLPISEPEEMPEFLPTPSITPQKNVNKCGNETKGLLFCTSTPKVIVNSGQDVNVEISLKNISQNNIVVPQFGEFNSIYEVSVMSSKRNKILSKLEILQKKLQEGAITPEERAKMLHTGNMPFTVELAPQEEQRLLVNLSEFYDFKTPDKYQVKISRKIAKFNLSRNPTKLNDGENFQVSLGIIEVEVKQTQK
jgi:hypothetical protein